LQLLGARRRDDAPGDHGACRQQQDSFGHHVPHHAGSGAAERHFEIWSVLYRAVLWRHKVNPATPSQINSRCDKKVA